jgi:hypothetical protein
LFKPLGSQGGPTTQFTLVEQGSSMAIRVASMSPKEQFEFCMGRKIAVPNVFPGYFVPGICIRSEDNIRKGSLFFYTKV